MITKHKINISGILYVRKIPKSADRFYFETYPVVDRRILEISRKIEKPSPAVRYSAEIYAKAAPTMFKKGQLPVMTRPVGAECWRDDGYLWVKVAQPNKWRLKHRVIWETTNGPIPDGHKIIFADGNRSNFDINNLICVSAAELARLNQRGLIFNNPEATKAGVLVARLLTKAGKIKRGE